MISADASTTNPLLPAPAELIIGIVVFVIVFGVLGKFLLPRIIKTLQEREDAIEGGIHRAEQAQAEAAAMREEYRTQLAEAGRDAARQREAAQEEKAQIIAEAREQAQAEARRILDAAQNQIAAERQQALQSLRAEVGALATDLASRIVGESLADIARQGRMIDRFLAEIEGSDAPTTATTGSAS